MSEVNAFKQSSLLTIAALFAVALGLGGYQWISATAEAAPQKAVAFQIKDIDGKGHHSQEWAGKIRLINFWATWCPPCVKEIPRLVELQTKYAESDFQVIGIALGEKDDVAPFSRENGINYPSLVGQTNVILAGLNYGNPSGALPYTVIVDQQDNIVYRHHGELTDTHIQHIEYQFLRNATKKP